MSVSDLIGLISGLLQFAVACYALRVSRRFGVRRVGWPFFAAFSLLALAHVLQTFHPLGIEMGFGISTNVFYEIISVLLLASIAQAELLVWKRDNNRKATAETASAAESKLEAERETWEKANAELHETVAKLQVEVTQQNEFREQEKASFQNQLTASQQQFEDARALVAAAQEQLAAVQEQLATAQTQLAAHAGTEALLAASQQQLKAVQEQLAVTSESERELHRALTLAQTENAQQKEILQRAKDAFQEAQNKLESAHKKKLEELEQAHWHQLIAGRQSEEALRNSIAGLEANIAGLETRIAGERQNYEQQKANHEQSENACRELFGVLRRSGLTEIATLSQTKVAHLGRIAKIIREHKKDLGRFIKSDPQGKQLPDSLSVIVEYLSDEQFLLLKKIGSVKKKIEELESALNLQSKTGNAAVHGSEKAGAPHFIGDVTTTGTETAGEGTAPQTREKMTAASPAKHKVVSRA